MSSPPTKTFPFPFDFEEPNVTRLYRRFGTTLAVAALAAGLGNAGAAHAAAPELPASYAQDASYLAGTATTTDAPMTSDATLRAILGKQAAKLESRRRAVGAPGAATTSIFGDLASGSSSAPALSVVMPGAHPSQRLDSLMRQLGPCAFGWC